MDHSENLPDSVISTSCNPAILLCTFIVFFGVTLFVYKSSIEKRPPRSKSYFEPIVLLIQLLIIVPRYIPYIHNDFLQDFAIKRIRFYNISIAFIMKNEALCNFFCQQIVISSYFNYCNYNCSKFTQS